MQRCVESLGDKWFSDVKHGQGMTSDNPGNFSLRFVSMEPNVGMSDRGGGRFLTVDEVFEERTLVVSKGEGNSVLALSHGNNVQQ